MIKIKYFTFTIVLILSFIIMLPAQAYTCRQCKGHQICILNIKRSAKNHWEYRALVSVDGVKTPIKTYNCRDAQNLLVQNSPIQRNGKVVPFAEDDVRGVICRFFKQLS
jgi:uncharacterized protein YlaI